MRRKFPQLRTTAKFKIEATQGIQNIHLHPDNQTFLLCGALTNPLQKLFRTHLRTAPQFFMIAPAPALTLPITMYEYLSQKEPNMLSQR